jgi:type I restriction enzyme R subunit
VNYLNKTPKSKASEMEHAIRWHIKVNLDKDPALYKHFKDRLETILNAYQENWEEIERELGKLREEMAQGRKAETEGISEVEAPFYDIIKNYLGSEDPNAVNNTKELMPILKETAAINNFWTDRAAERRRIEGLLEDEIRYSRIDGLSQKAAELAAELMTLARNREAELK